MGFDLNGYVLRPARAATGNASSTDEATTGVDRDHIDPATMTSLGYSAVPSNPVEPYADMYRAAVLLQPTARATKREYCLFAATTGSLSTIEDTAFTLFGLASTVNPIPDDLPVDAGAFNDGTLSFYVRDPNSRDISSVTSIVIAKGGATPATLVASVASFDPLSGLTTITDPGLGGGFSLERGDAIIGSYYVLAGVSFWWTRNDPDDGITRFGWDGIAQKWLPLKGSSPRNLGPVDPDETYKLTPPPSRFQVGDTLPGDPGTPDSYALVRVGLYPDAGSTPLEVRVVPDTTADAGWDGGTGNAIVGITNGVLVLNPVFADTEAGRDLWYNAETFVADADGDMGAVAGLPTTDNQGFPVLSPVPGATERPFLRIGNRQYLTPISVATDGDILSPAAITAGQFYWSRTTGKVVLSDADINRCTPGATGYDITFLGARLWFDGVALSTQPVPIRAPSAVVDTNGDPLDGNPTTVKTSSGDLYIQKAVCLPPPGVSGVSWVPDGSGDAPDLATDPQTRPNGSGLVRKVLGEAGDTFFFSGAADGSGGGYAYENVDVVEYDNDLPKLKIKVPKTAVAVSRMEAVSTPPPVAHASRIKFRPRPVKKDALYFRQTMVIPSVYSEDAVLYTRFGEPFTLDGTETIRLVLNATTYEWSAATLGAGDFTAQEIADSLLNDSTPGLPVGSTGVERGRVWVKDPTGTNIEIVWNTDQMDLTGHAALGLLPGWKVTPGNDSFRWLPDNGAALGVFRSPENLDRSETTPDIRSRNSFNNVILTDDISAVPFVTVNQPPLEDIPGYADGSHFRVQLGLLAINLKNYQTTLGIGIKYEWENNRFSWIADGVTNATSVPYPSPVLQLTDTGVLPETVSSAAMLDSAFGLDLKGATDTAYTELIRGTDFLMPGDGQPGQALRIEVAGGIKAQGGKGTFTGGQFTFTDPNVNQADLLAAVEVGYLLHILGGDAEGIYTIDVKVPGPFTELTVNPAFPAGSTTAQWRIYEAQTRDNLDGTLLADVKQVVTNHLSEEPFKIRVLTSAGEIPGVITVNPVDAVASNRIVQMRFGLESGSPEAAVSYLERGVEVGTVVESGLVLPTLTDPHVTNSVPGTAYFQIRIGANVFSSPGTLTIDQGTAPVGGVDVNVTTGAILIDPGVVSDLSGSMVYYDQIFLSPLLLSAGQCEINAANGQVNLSDADLVANPGATAYFVEQMVTENNLDVTISPVNGSILFNKPLRAMQVVEVNYFQADTNGDKVLDDDGNPIEITEFLPLTVRLEEATRVTDTSFTYNPTGRTLSDKVESFIWVGVELQNFAGVTTASDVGGIITLTSPAPLTEAVQINYGVLEAFGGEQAYTVSSPPVYRKPFWLDVLQDTFTLETNRAIDFPVGHLVLLGPAPLYIESVVYDAGEDTTTITVFPPPQVEVGSRAVGRDAGLTVSDFSVSVDRGGATGFMPNLNTAVTPLLPADKGQLQVAFYGDVRRYTKANHLLEIGGYPYIIVGATQSEDGRNTVVDLATPVYREHDNSDIVRVSVRPVYAPNPVEFTGIAPFLPSEEYDLFLLGRVNGSGADIPGKQLIEGVHYTVDTNTGSVVFQNPTQEALRAGEYLHFRYTGLKEVRPEIVDGALLYPFYKSQYLHMTAPAVENRVLGSTLKAQYVYRAPDSFYFSVLPLVEFLPEVESTSSSLGVTPVSSGAALPFGGSTDLSKQGGFGLRGDTQDLKDQDRAARAYISLFNGVVLAFEQVLEAIDGRIIGDRDGKFRFFIGRGKRYARPGWEDEITGDLVTRLIWRAIVNEWAEDSAFNGYYKIEDPVFDPLTAEEKDPTDRPGETDGKTPNPDTLSYFTGLQRNRVKNDMDDKLLIGFGRPRGLAVLFPQINIPGVFKQMWEAHPYSRLFPEKSKHFTRLYPGLEYVPGSDPGFYSSGRKLTAPGPEPGEQTEQKVKTRGSTIGTIVNPALGVITNVVDVTTNDRFPRARVWAYYPNGNADLDAALGTVTVGFATLVATPLPLGEFPVDPTTGFPDTTDLITTANPTGSLFSLESGDADLSTPAFEVGQQVNYGKPNDTTYTLTDSAGEGIFVATVQAGCVVTLGDISGTEKAGSDVFYDGAATLEEVVSVDNGYGDTVFGVPIVDFGVLGAIADVIPGDQDDLLAITAALPDYRIQFDLKVGKRTGEFIDASLAVKEDVFPLPMQTWLNQKPPQPLTCIEGMVEFINTDANPVKLPCLLGQDKDDSGDNQIPYLRGTDTELAVLGRVAADLTFLFVDTTAAPPHTWLAVYPDEIVISDGEILTSGYAIAPNRDPATLYTTINSGWTPVATAGSYTPNSGVGDVREGDFLFVETEQAGIPVGITGILSVGAVTSATLEVPRFVTPTESGTIIKHTIENAAVAVNGSGAAGVGVTETFNPIPPLYTTTFDFSTVGFVLDDNGGGAPSGIGGYNQFFGIGGTGNTLIIRIYDVNTGALVEAIAFSDQSPASSVWGTVVAPGGVNLFSPPTANGSTITVVTLAPISTVANDGTLYDVTISVDAYTTVATDAITGLGVGSATGTITAAVASDRLTFSETLSLADAADRATTTATGAVNVGTSLAVWEIEAGASPGCTVNAPASVNDGDPFTFLERLVGVIPYVGTFTQASVAGAGDESGTLRAMSWEAYGNTPLDALDLSGIKLAAAASSNAGESSLILGGTGRCLDATSFGRDRTWIQDLTVATGSTANVEAGDTVVIYEGPNPGDAAVKAGTYLVRHAVPTNNTASDGTAIFRVNPQVNAGASEKIDLSFPKVKTSDLGALEIVTGPLASVTASPTGHAFTATGRIFLILKDQYASYDAGTTTWTVDPDAVYSADYSNVTVDPLTGNATFTISGNYLDATGASLGLASVFFAAVTVGTKVSGMTFLPLRQLNGNLPLNNTVGHNVAPSGNSAIGGIEEIHLGSTLIAGGDKTFDTSGTTLVRSTAPFGTNRLRVNVSNGNNNIDFYSARDEVVYPSDSLLGPAPSGVSTYISLQELDAADWRDIHFAVFPVVVVPALPTLECLLPKDRVSVSDALTGGVGRFYAMSGVFLEPSIPLPVGDLGQALPHVVAASYSLATTSQIGMRNFDDFNTVPVGEEIIGFVVRRIRRFHKQSTDIVTGLDPLRFAYEIRRGEVSGYVPGTRTFTADTVTYGAATNLGPFSNADVNIHSGDSLRIIDPTTRAVTDTVEIQRVTGPTTLILRPPGLTETIPVGALFEVYLEQAIVPQEQSNEQLLDLITDKVVYERRVPYTTPPEDGGFVAAVNEMQDSGVSSWAAEGAAEGDYIVVDPAGVLYESTEKGVRPFGDQSTIERGAGLPYDDGAPSKLDDNRGFYQITSVDSVASGVLEVDGESRFSNGEPFGGDDPSDSEYVVLPTIHASTIPEGPDEGQQDLRVTAGPVGSSYRDRVAPDADRSLQPFAYKIIRPNPVFSQDAVELVLFMRERMLSWIEALSTFYAQGGDYYIFQRDDHIKDVGSSTDPTAGLGVIHNIAAIGLQGLVDYTPFANTSDCLSVLDRRFWVLDSRLDSLGYTEFSDDGFSQRPVLPDLIDDVLDLDDRFRDQRYAWITFRANQQGGSIQAAKRAISSLDARLQKQREAIARQKALDESS